MATIKVKALKNFGLGGKNIEAGRVVLWDEAKHGSNHKAFVKAGLIEVLDKPATSKKPETKPKTSTAAPASPAAAKTS